MLTRGVCALCAVRSLSHHFEFVRRNDVAAMLRVECSDASTVYLAPPSLRLCSSLPLLIHPSRIRRCASAVFVICSRFADCHCVPHRPQREILSELMIYPFVELRLARSIAAARAHAYACNCMPFVTLRRSRRLNLIYDSNLRLSDSFEMHVLERPKYRS